MQQQSKGSGHGMQKQKRPGQQPPRPLSPPLRPTSASSPPVRVESGFAREAPDCGRTSACRFGKPCLEGQDPRQGFVPIVSSKTGCSLTSTAANGDCSDMLFFSSMFGDILRLA
ncbi:hypothetical protein PspLS_00043 [Pyricularia sp. CBS 133598]|nr:hypothetical protein PspLS_00043 [Pyricularia sp. CBS 133598]